jgi:hypothetical protein
MHNIQVKKKNPQSKGLRLKEESVSTKVINKCEDGRLVAPASHWNL